MIKKNLHTRHLWLCFLSALIVFSTLIFAQEWRGKGRLRGTVLTEDGQPLPGVKVILMHVQYGAEIEFVTDEKGKWVAANIRGGAWNIDFRADGYEPRQISTTVSEVLRAKPIEISLKRTEKSIVTDKITALLASGNALYEQKNYQEAIQEYLNILKQNPELYMIHQNIGNAYYELDDYESAIEHYDLVLNKEPDSTEVLISLGNMYLEKGEIGKGLGYFDQIDMERSPTLIPFITSEHLFLIRGKSIWLLNITIELSASIRTYPMPIISWDYAI
jgi:tetratricopeptide (TPR) repeat protein